MFDTNAARSLAAGFAATVAALFAVAAGGQAIPDSSDATKAEVIAVDTEAREITVRFDDSEAVATFPVADDAEFFVWDGVIERPREFDDIVAGEYLIGLEFENVEGDDALRRAVSDESPG